MIATAVHGSIFEAVQRAITDLSGGFNPRTLFADGSIGVLYDNNDLTAFFSDSAGTQPAVVNGPVGLQLDKSQGLVLGAEIATNSDFSSGSSGWDAQAGWSFSGGKASVNSTGIGTTLLRTATASTDGKWYSVTFTVDSVSGTGVRAVAGLQSFASFITTPGTYTQLVLASGGGGVGVQAAGTNTIAVIDNVSIRELPGNHRYQTTTGSKPVLRGTPTGANLAPSNGDFSSSTGWTLQSGWTISGGTANVNSAVAGSTYARATGTSVIGKVYRITFTVTSFTSGGVYAAAGTATGSVANAVGTYVAYLTANTTDGCGLYAVGSATVASVDNIEIVDVSAGSVTAPYGLQYDGVDDFLQTASVNFSATDKTFVCAGVRKLSDAFDQATIAELGTNSAAVAGFALQGSPSLTARYRGQLYGTSRAVRDTSPVFAAPDLAVIAISFDIAGATVAEEIIGRRNGSVVFGENTLTPAGSGNLPSAVLYFGRRGGTSFPYNGLDFGLVIVGKTLTASQIASTERWIAQRTGVTL